jgi:glycosyltransferase involved in cell wall biosynthesis
MKIAFINGGGGARFDPHSFIHMDGVMRRLSTNGHEIRIIEYKDTPLRPRIQHECGITIVNLKVCGLERNKLYRLLKVKVHSPGWILERLLWTLSLVGYLRKNKMDAIYYNETFTALILIFIFPRIRRRLILHNIMPIEEQRKLTLMDKLRLYLASFVGNRINITIVESTIAQRALNKAGLKSKKMIVIEPGVEIGFWTTEASGDNIRKTYNLNDKMVILFQARVVPRKGVEYLIKAANILVHEKNYHNLAFVVVGPAVEAIVARPGTDELVDYVELLENLIKSLNLSSVVKLVIGWQPDDLLREFYLASDIYVLPTLEDMTPHSIKQAMAVGKPVVSTRVGWVPILIEDGKNGFLVEARQERALANALEKLIINGDVRRCMGTNNFQKVRERWTMEQETAQWHTILSKMPPS